MIGVVAAVLLVLACAVAILFVRRRRARLQRNISESAAEVEVSKSPNATAYASIAGPLSDESSSQQGATEYSPISPPIDASRYSELSAGTQSEGQTAYSPINSAAPVVPPQGVCPTPVKEWLPSMSAADAERWRIDPSELSTEKKIGSGGMTVIV